jgi:hypothetical protein
MPTATTVGYAPSDIDTALRGASRQLVSDSTCQDAELTNPTGPAQGLANRDYPAQCQRVREQVEGLVETVKKVIERRDEFASDLVKWAADKDGAHRKKGQIHGKESCETESIGTFVNDELKKNRIDRQIVWVDDAWHVIDRDSGGNVPSIRETPGGAALPATLVAYLNTRAELITAVQRAMDGCTKLVSLKLKIEDENRRRVLRFRLGKFDGNKLIVATLEEHTVRLGFSDDSKRLVYSAETAPHQITLVVKNTSGYEFSFGVTYSSVGAPKWGTQAGTDPTVPRTVVRTSDGRDLSPVLFVSFLWCEEPSDRSWYARACRSGRRGIAHWFPRLAVGLPISADLGRGSAYAGIALPYFPYVSLIGGVHLRRVQKLQGNLVEGGPIAGDVVPTQDALRVGGFVAIGVTEEIFNLLIPKLEPAK